MSQLSDTQLRRSRTGYDGLRHLMFVGVAQKVGTNAALVYTYLYYSLEGLGEKKPVLIDGVLWTSDSQFDILDELVYLSHTQLMTSLKNLQKAGLIIKKEGSGSLGRINRYTIPEKEVE